MTVSMSHSDNKRGHAYQRHFVAMELIEKAVIILEREKRVAQEEEFCLS